MRAPVVTGPPFRREVRRDGEADFGNIDYLYEEQGRCFLGGGWGDVAVTSAEPPSLDLT